MASRLLLLAVTGACVVTLLSGCSLTSGLGSSSSSARSASDGSSTSGGSSGGGSSATGTCALLPPSKLSSLTGKSYSAGTTLSPDGFGGDSCTYDSGVAVEVNTDKIASEQSLMVESTGAKPVSGIGDSAFYAAPSSSDNQQDILIVITGSKLVEVDDSSDSSKGVGFSLATMEKIAAAVG